MHQKSSFSNHSAKLTPKPLTNEFNRPPSHKQRIETPGTKLGFLLAGIIGAHVSITDLSAIPVEMEVRSLEEPLGLAPYVSNHDSVESVTRVVVRLDTDEGVTGWGEMLVGMKSTSVTKAVIEDVIKPEVIGRELGDIQEVREAFYYPYVKVRPFLGAVETALWDAYGKKIGAPVYELLGGRTQKRVPITFCLGILDSDTSRKKMREAVDAGFETVKTKAGHDWRQDVKRLKAMHSEVNGELEFRLDPNQGWSFEDAVRIATHLEEEGIYLQYLEQPVRIDTYGTYAKLRERLRTPIGVNEDAYFPRNLQFLLKQDAIDVAVVDLVPAGGILAAREQATAAASAGVSVSHHCGFDLGVKTAAMLHTVASTPSIGLPPDSVYYGWTDHIIEDPFEVEDGALAIPDGPGLGVTVNERKLEQYRCD